MNRPRRVLLITFIESFATICVERGIYFLSRDRLGFSDELNLYLALAFGVAYVLGALASHRISVAVSEKRVLLLCLGGILAVHLAMASWIHAVTVFAGTTAVGCLSGLKWPVIESYVGAGQTPRLAARAIGRFNISWSAAVPVCLVVVGPLIALHPSAIFLLAATLNLLSLLLALPMAERPLHIALDHPERPTGEQMPRYRALLSGSRWLLLASFSLMWILAALLPRILEDLGFSVERASGLSGVIDLVRLGAFITLLNWPGWHNRLGPLALPLLVLPAGFLMVMSGASLPIVLVGEVLFGAAAGLAYFTALYYAMVVKNASVDAGGAHEALIGLGFAAGPAAGIVGFALAPVLNSRILGTAAGIGPLVVLCSVGAIRAMLRAARSHR